MSENFFDVSAFAYAHRGLWGGRVPENSLAAFHSAREHQVGVELDVRLSADGVPHVFHDATLERMCGTRAALDSLSAKDLEQAFLPNGFPIPTLATVLAVMGDFPVLIELKVDAPGGDLAERVAGLIAGRPGRMTVMSFDEPTVARLCQLVTDRPVGLLIGAEPLLGVDMVRVKAARGRRWGAIILRLTLLRLPLLRKRQAACPW